MTGFMQAMMGGVSALAVSVSPTTATKVVTVSSTTGTTLTVVATISGGQAPYTYAWAWVSGGSGISILSPTSSATAFRALGLSAGEMRSGTARLTVTDNLGTVVQSQTVSVNISKAS